MSAVSRETVVRELRRALDIARRRGKAQPEGPMANAIELGALRALVDIVVEQLEAGLDPTLRLQDEATGGGR